MATHGTVVHEDRWGSIIVRSGWVEIRWYDSTAGMQWPDFQAFLTRFAEVVEQHRPAGALTDATAFRMDMSRMDPVWRDSQIVPRYNAAGLRKFAFHMPTGMPAIGAQPEPEGPANYPTGYFGTREDALAWLNG